MTSFITDKEQRDPPPFYLSHLVDTFHALVDLNKIISHFRKASPSTDGWVLSLSHSHFRLSFVGVSAQGRHPLASP